MQSRQTHRIQAEASAKTQRELPPGRLFTSSPVSVRDHISRILYSECALIFRRRLLERDPASPNLASRRSDGRLSSYLEFVGRGVLVKASLSLETQRFVEKDFRFRADFEEGSWQRGCVIDRAYRSSVWVIAEDMLVIIASIDKSSSGR